MGRVGDPISAWSALRGQFADQKPPVPLDAPTPTWIAAILGDRGVVEVGAGKGYWARQLSTAGWTGWPTAATLRRHPRDRTGPRYHLGEHEVAAAHPGPSGDAVLAPTPRTRSPSTLCAPAAANCCSASVSPGAAVPPTPTSSTPCRRRGRRARAPIRTTSPTADSTAASSSTCTSPHVRSRLWQKMR